MDRPPIDVVDRGNTLVIEVAGDECDQCPHAAHVRAYVYAELTNGPLSLCAHHGTIALPRLHELGARVHDMRYLLES